MARLVYDYYIKKLIFETQGPLTQTLNLAEATAS